MEDQKTTEWPIVAFKIGRGGEFNNPGRCTYTGQHGISHYTEDLFLVGEDGENPHWVNESGRAVGLTLQESETGIGRINHDGEYKTIYTKLLSDCTGSELWLIYLQEPQLILGYLSSYEDPQLVAVLHAFKVLGDVLYDEIAIDGECLSTYQITEVSEVELDDLDDRYCTIKTVNGRYYYRPD